MKSGLKITLDKAIIVGLGSNLPGAYQSCADLLEAALNCFPAEQLTVVKRSPWWRSAPWPDGTGPDYLNGVALVETTLAPLSLMAALLRLEADFGRRRAETNAPRTLDLDLIAHGRIVLRGETLTLPHPRAADRLFVMGPLAQIAPEWTHPLSGQTARRLATLATIGADAAPVPVG